MDQTQMQNDQTEDKQELIETQEVSKGPEMMFNQESKVIEVGEYGFYQDDQEGQSLFKNIEKKEEKKVKKVFKGLLEQKKFKKKNKNTPRFIVDLALKYLPLQKSQYKGSLGRLLQSTCQQMKDWHSQSKRNVYNLQHLTKLFGDQNYFTEQGAKLNRKLFSSIINKYSLTAMMQPRSQIADKVAYLRATKVFNLRCRNKHLVCRNQSE